MGKLKDILQSGKKHKEKVTLAAETIKKDSKLFPELMELFKTGTDIEKGTCAEIMKFVSKEKPELFVPHIETLVAHIDYKTPRVKWGVPETIAHIAQKYPEKTEKAIPKLLSNARDKSTVVRWCAAFALTEIAKNSPRKRKELISKFNSILKTEQNNGVRNVYLKTLKKL